MSNICQRCGLPMTYHTSGTYKCQVRKKPYKLRDGVDVKIGMRVWHYFPWGNPGDKAIITGTVAYIIDWGSIRLRKDPEEQKGIFDMLHDGGFTARRTCFSTLEAAQAFKAKCDARWYWLKKDQQPVG